MSKSHLQILTLVFLIIVTVAIVSAVHWTALSARAICFDDDQYLTENALVKNPSWNSASRFLREVLAPSTVGGYYQPLTMISLMLDYAAGGREDNLRPFHVTSLVIHTANTILIIVVLYLLFGNIWAAATAGVLFGVHPMTVETIAWVGERKTLLAAFFAFWSLLFHIRYAHTSRIKFYVGCFLAYVLALLSKPTSVPLPLVMLLMDYWPLRRLNPRSVFEKIPLFVLSTIFAVITYVSQSRTAGATLPTKFAPGYIPFVLCHNIIFYLHKIILPVKLSPHYTFPQPLGLSNPMILAGVIGTCMLIPLLILSLRCTRSVLTGWLIFFVAIFPAMGVIGFTNVIASDKFAYLPSIGLLMLIASLLIYLGRNNLSRIVIVLVVLILAGAETVATRHYLKYWRDTDSLYSHMLKLTPDAAVVRNNFGALCYKSGNINKAVEEWSKAVQLCPDYPDALNNLAWILATDKDPQKRDGDRAVQLAEKACQLTGSRDAAKLDTLAAAYAESGKFDEAVAAVQKGMQIAMKSERMQLADEMKERLSIYQRKQAFHRL